MNTFSVCTERKLSWMYIVRQLLSARKLMSPTLLNCLGSAEIFMTAVREVNNLWLYLLGGTLGKQVLIVSLPALTQTDKPPAQWRTLPDAPLESSAAIAVHGSLLAVGGSHGGQRSSAIHVYDQEKNAWDKVGDLPTERIYCACCLLPSGEILVAGGGGSASRMDVAAVKD